MNWLEKVLGISPDGGNGATEAAIVIGLALVVAVALAVRVRLGRGWRAK
jgi:hypothetical protein